MPPIRVLQVMPAMDAGGMETFVMTSTARLTGRRSSSIFSIITISRAFLTMKSVRWAGASSS